MTHPTISPNATGEEYSILERKAKRILYEKIGENVSTVLHYCSFSFHPVKKTHLTIKYEFDHDVALKPFVTINIYVEDFEEFNMGLITHHAVGIAWRGSDGVGDVPSFTLLNISNDYSDDKTLTPSSCPTVAKGPILCTSNSPPYEFRDMTPLPLNTFGDTTTYGMLHGSHTFTPGETLTIMTGKPMIVGNQVAN